MLNDEEPSSTSIFHLNGTDMQYATRLNRTSSIESLQRDFGEELNIEPLLAPPHFEHCSVIDVLYRSFPSNELHVSTGEHSILPSPLHMREDILSLWEEVASQIIEPTASASAHRSLQEPSHLAHRIPSAERMPPRKRLHAHSWDRLSTMLLGFPRSAHARSAPNTPCGFADSPPTFTANTWPTS
jgi:hypothetical protein